MILVCPCLSPLTGYLYLSQNGSPSKLCGSKTLGTATYSSSTVVKYPQTRSTTAPVLIIRSLTLQSTVIQPCCNLTLTLYSRTNLPHPFPKTFGPFLPLCPNAPAFCPENTKKQDIETREINENLRTYNLSKMRIPQKDLLVDYLIC